MPDRWAPEGFHTYRDRGAAYDTILGHDLYMLYIIMLQDLFLMGMVSDLIEYLEVFIIV